MYGTTHMCAAQGWKEVVENRAHFSFGERGNEPAAAAAVGALLVLAVRSIWVE